MASTFRCTIVTPSEAVFDEDVKYVSFPAWDGQQGVMHGQSPLLTRLGIGPMRVDGTDGSQRWWLVEGGFAQTQKDVLTVLTERATPAADLSVEEAEELLVDANARAVSGGDDQAGAEDDQQRARARRALAMTHGGAG